MSMVRSLFHKLDCFISVLYFSYCMLNVITLSVIMLNVMAPAPELPQTLGLIEEAWKHRYLRKVDSSSFVLCPLQALPLPRAFLQQPLTVLTTQNSQAVRATNESIFHRCLCLKGTNALAYLPQG